MIQKIFYFLLLSFVFSKKTKYEYIYAVVSGSCFYEHGILGCTHHNHHCMNFNGILRCFPADGRNGGSDINGCVSGRSLAHICASGVDENSGYIIGISYLNYDKKSNNLSYLLKLPKDRVRIEHRNAPLLNKK